MKNTISENRRAIRWRAIGWRTWAAAALAAFLASCQLGGERTIVVGSKNFTEQSLLGEMLAQQIERTTDLRVDRKFYLGGTLICHRALAAGEIDAYVEYTGTAFTAILGREPIRDSDEVYRQTAEEYRRQFGVELLEPLGFNNTFAILIRGEEARGRGLKTLSQASAFAAKWRPGFGPEFMERADGYRGLCEAYGLEFAGPPRVMDLGLTYRALADKQVDLIAGDMTNGLIDALDLSVLEDDREYFPPYHAVPFVRIDTLEAHPEVRRAFSALGGAISERVMRRLNHEVDGRGRTIREVATEFLDGLPASRE